MYYRPSSLAAAAGKYLRAFGPRLLFHICLLALASITCHAADVPAKPPKFPRELTLSNGTVIHDVSVVRWGEGTVTVKHSAGIDPIQIAYIAEPDRTAVLVYRDWLLDSQKLKAGETLKGQMFIKTQGAGNYKLGDVDVYIFTSDLLPRFTSTYVHLPAPVAQATTDSDGQFSITLPDDVPDKTFFVFAQAKRLAGGEWEHYDWRVESSQITNWTNILLTAANTSDARQVTIGN